MVPTLLPGQMVIATRRWRPLRVGDVVVVPDPRDPERLVVKRVARREERRLVLAGDNPEFSTDSRVFGPVRSSSVQFVLLRRDVKLKMRQD